MESILDIIRRIIMEVTGKLRIAFDIIRVSDTFIRREFILDIDANQKIDGVHRIDPIRFELHNEKVSLIDSFQPRDGMIVHFAIRGKEKDIAGKKKYFNSLDVWHIEKI